jgi:hypothetical protein
MKEMRARVRRITRDLNGLSQELSAIREEHAFELVEDVLTPEVIKGFKSSVDAMRRLLWLYIEAASRNTSRQNSHLEPNQALEGAVAALRSLRDGVSPPLSAAGGTFIEKVEAIVDRKIPSKPKH